MNIRLNAFKATVFIVIFLFVCNSSYTHVNAGRNRYCSILFRIFFLSNIFYRHQFNQTGNNYQFSLISYMPTKQQLTKLLCSKFFVDFNLFSSQQNLGGQFLGHKNHRDVIRTLKDSCGAFFFIIIFRKLWFVL